MDLLRLINHVWAQGHSVQVNRYNTALAKGASKGWHYKCECGEEWAR